MPLVLFTSCGTFPGKIVFRNESGKDIWVGHVEGFSYPPAVGILSKNSGGCAYSRLGRMEFPETAILHWSYQMHQSELKTEINMRDVDPPEGEEELFFVFGSDRSWRAYSALDE